MSITVVTAIKFTNGTFACDRWPDDLQQTVGRMVVMPWKSIYDQVTDRIHCGRVVRVVSKDKIDVAIATGGAITAPVSECFLVPESAEGGA